MSSGHVSGVTLSESLRPSAVRVLFRRSVIYLAAELGHLPGFWILPSSYLYSCFKSVAEYFSKLMNSSLSPSRETVSLVEHLFNLVKHTNFSASAPEFPLPLLIRGPYHSFAVGFSAWGSISSFVVLVTWSVLIHPRPFPPRPLALAQFWHYRWSAGRSCPWLARRAPTRTWDCCHFSLSSPCFYVYNSPWPIIPMLFRASPLKGALHRDEKEITVFNARRITNLKASFVWDFHLYVVWGNVHSWDFGNPHSGAAKQGWHWHRYLR